MSKYEHINYKRQFLHWYFNRVLAPEGELLFFASPKKSIQKKGDPLPLFPCASRLTRELIEDTSLYFDKRDSSLNRPKRVNPASNCDTRRGRRELVLFINETVRGEPIKS